MEETEVEKPQKENIGGREETCYSVYYWIFQVCSWGSLVWSILALRNDNKKIFILFGFVYFFYLVMELASNTSKYLRKKNEQEGLKEIMKRIFKTPPKISLFCECYHTRGSGKRRRRITKHSETYDIPYYSARDVSGLFTLNGRKEEISRKSFLKLDIEPEICFADEISFQDYMIQKTNFYRTNENKDEEFRFEEIRTIPDMDKNIFVKMSDDDPCFASFCVFLIFTILMMAEIYKLLFNCLCLHLKFKVRKLVSTRYNLNQPKYQAFNPQIEIYEERDTLEEDCYYNNFLDENNIPMLPTEEELRIAQQYKDKIPDYKITTEEENMKAGIVIDDPNIKFDPTEEPPKNIDVVLNQNQMNNAVLNQNQMNTNTNENQYMNSEQLKLNK